MALPGTEVKPGRVRGGWYIWGPLTREEAADASDHHASYADRQRRARPVPSAADPTARQVLGVLLQPARRDRHRSRADGPAVRRPHGAPRSRDLRHSGP